MYSHTECTLPTDSMMKQPENCADGKHVKIQKAIKLNQYDVITAGVGHMLSVLVYMKNQKYFIATCA